MAIQNKEDSQTLPMFGVQIRFAIGVIKSIIKSRKESKLAAEDEKKETER